MPSKLLSARSDHEGKILSPIFPNSGTVFGVKAYPGTVFSRLKYRESGKILIIVCWPGPDSSAYE